jgi:acetyl esterase/lipase
MSAQDILLTDSDPRLMNKADPRLLRELSTFGLNKTIPKPHVNKDSSLQAKFDYVSSEEKKYKVLLNALVVSEKDIETVSTEEVTITGVDNNEIILFIHTPTIQVFPAPCVYYIHGGGMTINSAKEGCWRVMRSKLAALGIIVVGVEFRNAAGTLGPHRFPKGLNDCFSGLEWLNTQKESRGISNIVLSGESGGANLSLALCFKVKNENKLFLIDGVYAFCPYIFGDYDSEESVVLNPSLVVYIYLYI